ncbi:MAG TPA: LysE family translocator, partial [Polyangiaceae bacterium]
MTAVIPQGQLFLAFLLASFVLAVTPGPGVFYIVTRTLAQGRCAGIASVLGVALGNLGNAFGASIGLAALFAISSLAFTLVRCAGASYLIFLGVKAWLSAEPEIHARDLGSANVGHIFRDGFVVAFLNPKTAVFFAAFLPQFMSPSAPHVAQSMLLGSLFVAIASITDTAYAMAASVVGPRLGRFRGARSVGRYAAGSALIGL